MSLANRSAQLEDVDSGRLFSVPLAELPDDPPRRPEERRRVEYPQERVSNLGRVVVVDRAGRNPDCLVFSHAGRQVAELRPLRRAKPGPGRALIGWRLTFPSYPETVLTAPPGEPPVNAALFLVDVSLADEGFA